MNFTKDKRFMKRFEAGKAPQIEQLISYVTLLGLSGRDLIAVGGKMEREKTRQTRIQNDEIVKTFEVEKIGQDYDIDHRHRFKVRTVNGSYNIENDGYSRFIATNTKSKQTRYFAFTERPVGARGYSWGVKQMILAVYHGDIKLDF